MAEKNLFCDQLNCGHPAKKFCFMNTRKSKVCTNHETYLFDKGVVSFFDIAAYQFMETEQDRELYCRRQAALQQGRIDYEILKASCQKDFDEAQCMLQTAQTDVHQVIEATFLKMKEQVQHTFESVLSLLDHKLHVLEMRTLHKDVQDKYEGCNEVLRLHVEFSDCSVQIAELLQTHFVVLQGSKQPSEDLHSKRATLDATSQTTMTELDTRALQEEPEQTSLEMEMSVPFLAGHAELFFQAGFWRKTIKTCEKAFGLNASSHNFELLCLVYYYTYANLNLELIAEVPLAIERVDHMTDPRCKSVWLCINADPKKQAAGSLEEALVLAQQYVPSSYITACTQHQLGWLHLMHQSNERAESELLQALKLLSTHFSHTLEYARCCGSLGQLYMNTSRWEDGIRWQKQAYDSYCESFGKSEDFVQCVSSLGLHYESRKQLDRAQQFRMQACELCAAHFPQTKLHALCLENLGLLYAEMKQEEKAEEYFVKACEVYSQRFPQSIEFANCLNNFGFLYSPKRPEKEIQHFSRALQIYYSKEPSLGMAKCLSNLAFSYGAMEDFETAEARYQEACELHAKHFPNTIDFADCLNNRGVLQMLQSNYSQAEALLLQAKGIYEKLSPHSANLAQCLDNLGVLFEEKVGKSAVKRYCPSVKRLF